jgi:hypothetical protein
MSASRQSAPTRRSSIDPSNPLPALVSRAREGDQDAWNALDEIYQPLV